MVSKELYPRLLTPPALAELPRVRRRIVVFGGERPQATEDGIELLPVREFLHEVESGALFP